MPRQVAGRPMRCSGGRSCHRLRNGGVNLNDQLVIGGSVDLLTAADVETVLIAVNVIVGRGRAPVEAADRDRRAVGADRPALVGGGHRSEEHTSELQSLMRISYAGFCLKKKHN